MEYMMIVGFTMLVIIAIIVISSSYSNDVKESINLNQLDQVVKAIIESAESVYYFGEPSKTTLKVFIPEHVQQVILGNKSIIFEVQTTAGLTDVGYKTTMPLNGTISIKHGYHYISIEAKDGYVWLNST
jgi:hypothetical protein